MSVQIGARPDSGFDDPIGMLKDCHRRVERFLRILCQVVERAHGRSLDAEESAAVQAALHYFRTGGLRHTADEEESLFPRLRAETAAASGSTDHVAALEHDHRNANELHAEIDRLYSEWLENRELTPEQARILQAATVRLEQLYTSHIDIEVRIVFPKAAQLLSSEAIAQIGEEFRRRRT
jgi:hemerythrin-like domain-containing protein